MNHSQENYQQLPITPAAEAHAGSSLPSNKGRRKADYTPEQWAAKLARQNRARRTRTALQKKQVVAVAKTARKSTAATAKTPRVKPEAILSLLDQKRLEAYDMLGGKEGFLDGNQVAFEWGYVEGLQAVIGICRREIERVFGDVEE